MSGLAVNVQGKGFERTTVLHNIQFELKPGERACLLGPSGCGKSTLLSLIAGLDADFDGVIDRPEGPVAMIFQTPRLLPWRTLVQNIVLTPGACDEAEARRLLGRVELSHAADQYPEKVSLGMQRRAALARALSIRPALVLMDEPLVSLDTRTATEMRGLITRMLDDSGATALIATHDLREALGLADRVIELADTPTTIARNRSSPLDRAARREAQSVEDLHAEWFSTTIGRPNDEMHQRRNE